MKLIVLGSAQDAGVPQPGCHCAHCVLAAQSDHMRRLPPCLAVVDEQHRQVFVVDAPLTFDAQLTRLRHMLDESFEWPANGLLLTHAHLGHFPGMLFLGREALNVKNFPVYASKTMVQFLNANRPFSHLAERGQVQYRPFKAGEPFQLTPTLTVTAIEVEHRNEDADTHAFVFEQTGKRALYAPDLDRWTSDLFAAVGQSDVALVDGSFFSLDELPPEVMQVVAHPPITEAMTLLDPYKARTQIWFTHFNHTNPVVNPDSAQHQTVLESGYHLAYDKLTILP